MIKNILLLFLFVVLTANNSFAGQIFKDSFENDEAYHVDNWTFSPSSRNAGIHEGGSNGQDGNNFAFLSSTCGHCANYLYKDFQIKPNAKYTVKVLGGFHGTSPDNYFKISNNKGQEHSIHFTGSKDNWPDLKEYTLTLTPQSGATTMRIMLNRGNLDGYYQFDDIRIYEEVQESTPTIIADYHFDECSWNGNTGEVKDSSGNNFNGKAYGGATTFADSKIINRSGKFIKSQGQYVKVTNFNNFNQDSFTASLWIKVHENVSGWQTILHKGSSNNSSNGVFRIKYNYNGGDDKLGIYSTSKDGDYQNFYKYHIGLKDKQWHHLIVTFKNREFKVYLDKTLVASKTYSKNLKSPNNELHIGGKYYKSNMYIDEVKLYNGTLSQSEINSVYNNEKAEKNYDGSARSSVSCGSTSESVCYAISDVQNKLYKVYMSPSANPLPVATKIDITGISDNIDGEGGAYNSGDGLIYAFHESSSGARMYTINPANGVANYKKTFTNMKKNIVGASFYGGYFYVIAKTHDGDATLYKVSTDNWSILSTKNVNGDTTDADALAINKLGNAYIITDNNKKLYNFDLNTAKTTYKFTISTNTDAEAISFAKDGNLYVENSENGASNDTDKIFKIDLSSGNLTPAAQIPHADDIDIESLSCNIVVPSSGGDVNAMLLTRGDNNNNDKTNVYVFHVDTDTDTISNFHLLKKLNVKFRALTYHNGKFYTSDMSGNIYTIDIDNGNYSLDTTYGKIDSTAIGGMDFDGNENILYSIWSPSYEEQRKLRKYTPSTGSSIVVATVPDSDHYIDYGVAYFGDGKTVVTVGSGAVRFINNTTVGQHIESEEWCVYGAEYVGEDKGYFVNAESNDLSIYKLDGTSWSKIYTYGTITTGNKGVAIAVVHDSTTSTTPPLPSVTINDIAKYEGDSGITEYKVTVNLNPPAPTNLTMTYSTEDGTAKLSDSDYQRLSGTKTVPKGSSHVVLTVKVNGDKKVENDEYFYLNVKLTN